MRSLVNFKAPTFNAAFQYEVQFEGRWWLVEYADYIKWHGDRRARIRRTK